MRSRLFTLALVAGFVAFLGFCVVILDERELGFRTLLNDPEFELMGIPLNQPLLTEPGLYLRIPGLHQLYRYDRRVLRHEAEAQELYTQEELLIEVDYFAIWQIEDPRLFFESVRTYAQAAQRIDNVTYGELRETLALHGLADLLSEKRPELTSAVARSSDEKLRPLGIRIRDLRIKRADYPDSNLVRIYDRMRSERERFAKKARAEGEEAAREIRSVADREGRVILAEAVRESEQVRGEGDAESTKIYSEAHTQDGDFYAFLKSLETYRKTLDDSTMFVLTPKSHFLRYLFPSAE